MAVMPASDTIEAAGHLIDSGQLSAIFDKIIELQGAYEVLKFDIGRTNDDPSRIQMRITTPDQATLDDLLQQLTTFGCHPVAERNVVVKPAEKDRCVPDDFYSTTNHRTHVRLHGKWVEVASQRMDSVIVVTGAEAECRKLRDVRAGESIVCGHEGIRVLPEFRERDRLGFTFMSNDVSSERRVEGSVARIAMMMRDVRKSGGRIAVVAGPVVDPHGRRRALRRAHSTGIRRRGAGWQCARGPRCGVRACPVRRSASISIAGAPVEQGHRNHMAAINVVNRAGSIRAGGRDRRPESGVMYECVKHGVDYVLAGSIRDDGPLPETLMDLVEAQERYAAALPTTCSSC